MYDSRHWSLRSNFLSLEQTHKLFIYLFPGNKGIAANTDMKFIHQPVAAIFRVVQRGLDAAVRLHILMHLRRYESPRVLISEGLALTVSALGAQVCTVCHLILLQSQKQNKVALQESTQAVNFHINHNINNLLKY